MLFGAVLTELQLTQGIQPCYREQRHGAGNKDMGWGIQKIWRGTTIRAHFCLKFALLCQEPSWCFAEWNRRCDEIWAAPWSASLKLEAVCWTRGPNLRIASAVEWATACDLLASPALHSFPISGFWLGWTEARSALAWVAAIHCETIANSVFLTSVEQFFQCITTIANFGFEEQEDMAAFSLNTQTRKAWIQAHCSQLVNWLGGHSLDGWGNQENWVQYTRWGKKEGKWWSHCNVIWTRTIGVAWNCTCPPSAKSMGAPEPSRDLWSTGSTWSSKTNIGTSGN